MKLDSPPCEKNPLSRAAAPSELVGDDRLDHLRREHALRPQRGLAGVGSDEHERGQALDVELGGELVLLVGVNLYDADAVAELEKQLLLERANNQKMMLQMLEMQNDVNRGSAKIVELKQETAGLRSQLVARDRMHADDARMRLQLGKRLQQLVFDNAALRRTCDDLERHAQKAF